MTYSPATTTRKAITAGLSTAMIYALMEYLTAAPELTAENWKVLAIGLTAAAIRGITNWWKNHGKQAVEKHMEGGE